MDEDDNLKQEFSCYNLCTLMANCVDFKEEKSLNNHQKIDQVVSPKYHCNLAGKGV